MYRFNAYHDNNEKCKDSNGQTVSLNVMAPTLDISAHPWTWSRCSAKYITGFLEYVYYFVIQIRLFMKFFST